MSTDKIILGTAQFGLNYGINNLHGKLTQQEVFDILEVATQNGIQLLDTADAYGNASEMIGIFHDEHHTRFRVNTKFRIRKDIQVSDQAYQSLKTLKIACIQVYFCHHFEDIIKYPEILPELEALKKSGIIMKTGVSVYDNKQFEQVILSGFFDVIQVPFNLLDNAHQRGELIKLAKKNNIEIQIRSVFLQGLFFKSFEDYPEYLAPLKKYIQTLNNIAKEASLNMNQLALAYALSQPGIDYILAGVDNKYHLQQNLSNMSLTLTPGIKQRIDEICVEEVETLYPFNWK